MQGLRAAMVLAIASVLLNGCGTICNFVSGDPEVYGGPQKDIEFIQTPRQKVVSQSESGGKAAVIFLALVLADVPVSFVADTLTLPLTIYLRQHDANSAP